MRENPRSHNTTQAYSLLSVWSRGTATDLRALVGALWSASPPGRYWCQQLMTRVDRGSHRPLPPHGQEGGRSAGRKAKE